MKYFVLAVESYDGDTTCRNQMTWGQDSDPHDVKAMYAVVSLEGDHAEIVDDGYRSLAEAKEAWPEAT
jgi:hypothetical protein